MTRKPRVVSAEDYNKIIELAKDGVSPAFIGLQMPHISMANIHNYVCKARARGLPIPRFPAMRYRRLKPDIPASISIDMVKVANRDRFTAAAKARGISESTLLRKMVIAAINDDMIGAILDDGK